MPPARSNPSEDGSESNHAAIVASPANSSNEEGNNAPQANVLSASRRLLVEQRLAMCRYEDGGRQSSNASNVSTGLHPSAGGPGLQPDRAANERDGNALEKGKADSSALVKAYTVYPTATAVDLEEGGATYPTTVASFPHPEEHTRTANDRALASIINADNMNDIPIVPGQIMSDENEKGGADLDKLEKPMKQEEDGSPPKGYFARDTRRGAALLVLILATIALVVILCVTVPKSRAQSNDAAPSSAVEGSTAGAAATLAPSPTPPPTLPPITERFAALRRTVLFYGITPAETLDDASTAQHAALDWLANVDSGSSWVASDDVRVVQRYALATLYYATRGGDDDDDDDGWTETYGWLSDKHECEWYAEEYDGFFDFTPTTHGILCESAGFLGMGTGDTVLHIRLDSNNLKGTIPSEIEALSSLEALYLSDNSIEGTLTPELLAMPNLEELVLPKNKLSGEIPDNIGESTMTYLDFSSNNLEGPIPDAVWDMSQLTTLNLAENSRLTGQIGDNIGDMSSLQILNLGNLDLDGTIPESIGDIATLQVFNASHNGLTGPIPDDAFDWLPMITTLDLEDNDLSGTIPSSLARKPHPMLTSINLQKNRLSGEIPSGLAMNVFLTFVGLSDNELEGEVPWTWGTFMLLNTLTLDRNQLSGDVESLCYVQMLTADCLGETPEVECSCCSQCCDADGLCDPEFLGGDVSN